MTDQDVGEVQLESAAREFLRSCDRNYSWPAGNEVQIPMERERRLLELLLMDQLSHAEKGKVIAQLSTDGQTGFSIATFGIRIACLGVRNASVELFRLGVLVFVAAGPDFDWRDSLMVISVLECLAKLLNVDVFEQLKEAIDTLDASRWKSVIQNYRTRSEEEKFDWMERLMRSSPSLRDFMPL